MSLLKRATYQPQEVETIAEPKEGFAMVDFKDIDTVIGNLTAAEMKLWLYLQKLDRYGDKMKDLPTPQEFAIRLGLSRRTVEKAAFRLDDLGLYTFRVKAWQGANSSAARAHQTAKKMKAAKEEREASKPLQGKGGYLAEDAANLPESGYLTESAVNLPEKRLNNPNQPPEPLPQADSKTPHTSSDYSDLIQTTTDKADVAAAEEICSNPNSLVSQPTQEEVEAAHQEIARISPEIEINSQVKKLVLEFWANLPAAIAHTKKAVREPWCKNPTGILCKALKNPSEEAESAANEIKKELPKPNKEQRTQLQKLGKPAAVEMPDGLIAEAIDFGGGRVLPWWRALNIPFEQLQQP